MKVRSNPDIGGMRYRVSICMLKLMSGHVSSDQIKSYRVFDAWASINSIDFNRMNGNAIVGSASDTPDTDVIIRTPSDVKLTTEHVVVHVTSKFTRIYKVLGTVQLSDRDRFTCIQCKMIRDNDIRIDDNIQNKSDMPNIEDVIIV